MTHDCKWEALIAFAKERHKGHMFAGFDHIERVYRLCMRLAEGSGADMEVLTAAAYLHDIAVPLFGPQNHHKRSSEAAGDILSQIGFPKEKEEKVFRVIGEHTRYDTVPITCVEGEIIRDADGLEYIGAIGILRGIARGFKSQGYTGDLNGQAIPLLEKLITRVEGTFLTETGKRMAQERLRTLKNFVESLRGEFNDISIP